MMKDIDDLTIAIVGLGLMGGSLAMALKRRGVGRRVLGADANEQVVVQAMALGAMDVPCEGFADVDLIVLAMPVRAIIAWLNTHGTQLRGDQMVMDLGSTKRETVSAMDALQAQCVGGHPMCGKERAGIDAADADLFEGATFVLTPTRRTSDDALQLAQQLVTRVGAQPLCMDAQTHDRAVAAISHLPYLLSVSLVNTVSDLRDANAAQLAASGYRSVTRLAASDVQMMNDIVVTNRAHILDMLDRFQVELGQLRAAIAAGDEENWHGRLEQAKKMERGV